MKRRSWMRDKRAHADVEVVPDRSHRRIPFTAWVRRFANLRNSSLDSPRSSKKGHLHSKSEKAPVIKNNPYPESGYMHRPPPADSSANGHLSFSTTPISRDNESYASNDGDSVSQNAPAVSDKSAAPTLATNPETVHSDAGQSKTGTSNTVGGGLSSQDGGRDSTFSSPNHSQQSLTTTLTTIQSTAPSALLGQNHGSNSQHNAQSQQAPVHFSHQYPISPPASALPAHLAPQPNPHTYSAATANNMLTDNASILTLASSSKRRRRHSLDTDASVRALAPSSVWGGSRESLPLSVLSGNVEAGSGIYASGPRPSVGGLASAERASVYSSSGVAPGALSSERNSYYANKVDGGSVRSGLFGHGRTESINGSIGGPTLVPGSPLASPNMLGGPGRMSRRSSDRREAYGESDAEDGEEVGHGNWKQPVKENAA